MLCTNAINPSNTIRTQTGWFMTHVTCMLTAKHRDRFQNRRLGNRVWATTFTIFTEQENGTDRFAESDGAGYRVHTTRVGDFTDCRLVDGIAIASCVRQT